MQSQHLLDGRYRLLDHLGNGGMSVVWEARDEVLDRRVAVKILAGPHATDPLARMRIRAEAQAAARLWHPNVTNVYDYGESPGESGERVPYVVMEFLPGCTLSERLGAGPMSPRTALRICAEVAGALAAAHAQDLVHRDVKPSNVMLTPSGAKVVDFGIAAVAGRSELEVDGQLLGTPAYLAPERLTGEEVLPASDVYALGLLIHRALTNELPWQAETTTQMLTAHVYVEPTRLPVIEGVPAEVNEVCDRCLAKDPADRPSANEVAKVLESAAGIVRPPEDTGSVPASAEPATAMDAPAVGAGSGSGGVRRRRRVAVAVALAVVIGAVAVSAALADSGSRRDGGNGGAAGPRGSTADPSAGTGDDPTASTGPGSTGAPDRAAPPAGAGGTQSGAPATGPGATQIPSAGAPEPPPGTRPGVPVVAVGGIVRVRCAGKNVEVLGVEPVPGFTIKDRDPGPADQVQVVLISPVHESEIKVRCRNGLPVPKIKESLL